MQCTEKGHERKKQYYMSNPYGVVLYGEEKVAWRTMPLYAKSGVWYSCYDIVDEGL
jgi:hypothetical protein